MWASLVVSPRYKKTQVCNTLLLFTLFLWPWDCPRTIPGLRGWGGGQNTISTAWASKEGLGILTLPLFASPSLLPVSLIVKLCWIGVQQTYPCCTVDLFFYWCSPRRIRDQPSHSIHSLLMNADPRSSHGCQESGPPLPAPGLHSEIFDTKCHPFWHPSGGPSISSQWEWLALFGVMYRENEMDLGLNRQKEGPVSSQLLILLGVQCWNQLSRKAESNELSLN